MKRGTEKPNPVLASTSRHSRRKTRGAPTAGHLYSIDMLLAKDMLFAKLINKLENLRRYPTYHSCPEDEQDPQDVMQLRGCSQYFIGGPTHFYLRPNRNVQGFAAFSRREWSNGDLLRRNVPSPLPGRTFSDWTIERHR